MDIRTSSTKMIFFVDLRFTLEFNTICNEQESNISADQLPADNILILQDFSLNRWDQKKRQVSTKVVDKTPPII